jgi:ABC-2 type transport system permease protein
MLGGCMWPLEIVGDTVRAIGHVTPHAWAMDGWVDLVFDGESAVAVLPEVAVLLAYGAVLGVIATKLLRRALTG